MKIKCPYCGSTEYETFDTTGGDGEPFRVIYALDCIEKES